MEMSTTTTILGVDPGGTTGVSLIEFGFNTQPKVLKFTQIPNGLDGFLAWYHTAHHDWDLVVCESFTLRPGVHGVDLSATYVIGALQALEQYRTKIFYQAPSQKSLCDDEAMKQLGVYLPGNPHANDAARHAIIYLRSVKHLPTLKKGWPQ
jgi:hypothetical protein